MNTIITYEYNGALSLDKEYLEGLADGGRVELVYAVVSEEAAIELVKRYENNTFNFDIYNGYLEDGNEDAASEYFEKYSKCLNISDFDIKTFTFQNDEIRELYNTETSTLKGYSEMGGYTLLYLDNNGSVYCNECAPNEIENIVKSFIHWEGEALTCENCGKELESEYGIPEENK